MSKERPHPQTSESAPPPSKPVSRIRSVSSSSFTRGRLRSPSNNAQMNPKPESEPAKADKEKEKRPFTWRTPSSPAESRQTERWNTLPRTATSGLGFGEKKGGRLKPAVAEIGFVSKGDDRLLDYRIQESYHATILDKYLNFCGTSGGPEQLEADFSSLSINPIHNPHPPTPVASKNAYYSSSRNAELSSILLAMRKLREGLVASHRTDAFTIDVYKHQIRTAILVQQVDTYYPALLHLLNVLHRAVPLPRLELQEFAAYQMLHLAMYMEDYSGALDVKREFSVKSARAVQALTAAMHGNYWSWRAARNRVDQYLGRLMDFHEERMRKRFLKCVGASYFTVEKRWLEMVAGMSWEELVEKFKVGWELNEKGVVCVRRQRQRVDATKT